MKYRGKPAGGRRIPSGARLMATALAAGTAAVLAVFLAFALYQDFSQNTLRKAELNKYLETVGSATAWGADNWLKHRTTLADNLADTVAQNFNGVDAEDLVHNKVYEGAFLWTYFGEANGKYHIWPPDDELPADYDPRIRPWYAAALLAGAPTLTEPYFDISTMVETITVAAPVYRDGQLLGVVGADFSTASLSDVLKETNVGGLGHAFLVTGEGKILAHPDRELVSRDIAAAYPGQRPEIRSGVQYLEHMAEPQIVTFHKIASVESVDWYLGISVDKRAAFLSVRDFRLSAAIATLAAALLLVTVLGFVIHRVLVRPLMKARLDADAANVAKSEFLASMSHEIRTPMNGVLGMAEVLSNTNLEKRQRELTSIIISSGNALMTVINDILDFSKLEAGKFKLIDRPFNLRQTVYEVATMMQARALEKKIELIVRYAPNLPEGIVADDARLRQVLCNLIGNAVKFTEHGYVLIDVTGERMGGSVNIKFNVKDTGVGIPQGQIPRMFEKFEQADASHTRRFGGTGLGLAICKNIVDLMGGEIGAESELDKGSTFWFTVTAPVADQIKSMPAVNAATFDGVRVLAVDDNAVNRRILQELIEGWGFRVTVAPDPVGAMAALEKSIAEHDIYHAAILDFQMPGEDGLSLATRIKNEPYFASLPIVMLSSIDDASLDRRAQEEIVDAYLAKPVRPSQLMDALAQVLSDGASQELRRSADRGKAAMTPETKPAEKIKILAAEDNTVNQMVLTQFIDEDRFELFIADNGETAVELYKQHAPALVLMDLSMPVMDGFKATAVIRAYERENNLVKTPIIATTAHVLVEDRNKCRDAGMDDFIPKPMNKSVLDEKMDHWLAEAAEYRAAAS